MRILDFNWMDLGFESVMKTGTVPVISSVTEGKQLTHEWRPLSGLC